MESADYRNVSELSSSLNKSMSEIELWAKANKLPLNEEKTKLLVITGKRLASKLTEKPMINKEGRILKVVESATLFGLEIDSKLSFTEHVEKVCKKLASRIAVLRKIRGFLPLSQRLEYYNAVIRPVMSFSNVIWSECDKDLLNRILRLQKRAARVILFADRLVSSVSLFNKLLWIPFYEQCKIDKCSILYKGINGILPNYLNEHIVINNNIHSRNTKYSNFNGRTFSVSSTKLWNSLTLEDGKAHSLKSFKKNLWSKIFKEQKLLQHFSP